jgi:hypothetical protein
MSEETPEQTPEDIGSMEHTVRSEKALAAQDTARALEQGRVYVRACRARGESDRTIAKSLEDTGWGPEEIEQLFESMKDETEGGPAPPA